MRLSAAKILSFLLFLTITGTGGCQGSKEKGGAEELTGIWETAEPRYAGCTFEIKEQQIIFENPVSPLSINRIVGTKSSPEGSMTLYEIEYEDRQGLEYTLSLYFHRGKEGEVIWFKNQKGVKWIRKGPPKRDRSEG